MERNQTKMGTQIMRAMGPASNHNDDQYSSSSRNSRMAVKPLPSPPSPTLTNPDMVLPNEPIRYPALPSPPRRRGRGWARPPSPGYLVNHNMQDENRDRVLRNSASMSAIHAPAKKKEKMGLMSRKMMLLRSRTASGGPMGANGSEMAPRSVPSDTSRPSEDYGSGYASSPTLMDVGNLAPERPQLEQEDRRPSASGSSSFGSDDMAALPHFLAMYEKENREMTANATGAATDSGTDDEQDTESRAPQLTYGDTVSIDSGLDAHRRQQEEDEQNSAILSKRAEEILANAKKRLNLMEGNLRGARDLVQPLTAANLKRATSVGAISSSYTSSAARSRYVYNDYSYEPASQQTYRTLHAQASSPTITNDYHTQEWRPSWRGFDDPEVAEVPDRPHTALERTKTALERTNTPIRLPTRNTIKGSTQNLRDDGLPLWETEALANECSRPRAALERTNTPIREVPTRSTIKDSRSESLPTWSTNGLDRPHTALERTNTPMRGVPTRVSIRADDPSWRSNGLRGSKSHDSLGQSSGLRHPVSRDVYSKGSPISDSNLEPLVEDDGQDYHAYSGHSTSTGSSSDQHDGLGIYGPESRTRTPTSDLRDQMSSLKGRISSLQQRAREDSLRRQSVANLREPSPLNNATAIAPEFFYTSSQSYGSPVLDTNAGVGRASQKNSPVTPQLAQKGWDSVPDQVFTGSRNAFAEQLQTMQPREGEESPHKEPSPKQSPRQDGADPKDSLRSKSSFSHKRTPSGTAIVQSSKHRYSHHQYYHVRNISNSSAGSQGRANGREIGIAQGGSENAHSQSNHDSDSRDVGLNHDRDSESGDPSVYEDAEAGQAPPVVAHEDREDAFDYETFFLHSAMGPNYKGAARRESASSEDTVSSSQTARGPAVTGAEEEEEDRVTPMGEEDKMLLPISPGTPERLREIERNLHKRTFSNESVSTVATFATATEGRESPTIESKRSSILDWPIRSPESTSRPNTAIPTNSSPKRESSSERADSGVGLPRRPMSSQSSKRSPLGSVKPAKFTPAPRTTPTPPVNGTSTLSPPKSPRAVTDPATTAVNALLHSGGRQLGLKDKALLFGLVESLRGICHKLQEREEGDYESRMLRSRIDEAKRALEGAQ